MGMLCKSWEYLSYDIIARTKHKDPNCWLSILFRAYMTTNLAKNCFWHFNNDFILVLALYDFGIGISYIVTIPPLCV